MKQIETLQLIRARCVELLEQAKLRTPGAWLTSKHAACYVHGESERGIASTSGYQSNKSFEWETENPANATYIANASVAFEAALESTVAALDGIQRDMAQDSPEAESIITAWKHLLP